ncbi:hypothetical protein [Lactobacillus sp. W8093]|uniref:hypothetical protein n=1 Tax=Lactobacillus sp. W8093 TaxID=2751038 RepID=UPI0018EF57D3|nr:hypothetical protein [Lactobacillus sp. W8093]MBI0110912.1 hypothetical protein [Lactobacillus sp. W8093]
MNKSNEKKIKILYKVYNESLKKKSKGSVLSNSKNKKSAENKHEAAQTASIIENDTNNDAIVNQAIIKLIISISNVISSDEEEKNKIKKPIIWGMIIYFVIMTVFVAIVILNFSRSNTLIRFLLGGFFTNMIGLLVIIFKYIFAPSKDLYNLMIKLEDRYQTEK